AARQRVATGLHQLAHHLLVALAVEIREERNLDGGETLQLDVRANLFESAQQLRVVVPRQIGMQPVDEMNFGERLVTPLAQLVPRLLERHRVRAAVARLEPRKGAEEATRDADVGRLQPDIEVVERAAAVPPLALAIGEPADREQVGTVKQAHAFVERQPDAGVELVSDISETGRAKTSGSR